MTTSPYVQLIRYKQWADRGLYDVIAANLDRLVQDMPVMILILDHIHAVDRIFQHHLQGIPHAFKGPRSEVTPDLPTLASGTKVVDDWYVSHVDGLSGDSLDQPLDFTFTNGNPARMTRGEIILHVCSHGTYHRGNAGILLQKNGIAPNRDGITDFLEAAA